MWNAYACRTVKDPVWRDEFLAPLERHNGEIEYFRAEANRTTQVTGVGLEDSLADGCLACRDTARMLAQATGEAPFGTEWPAHAVQVLAAIANWDFPVDRDMLSAKLSAECFLNTCARLGLSIRFD